MSAAAARGGSPNNPGAHGQLRLPVRPEPRRIPLLERVGRQVLRLRWRRGLPARPPTPSASIALSAPPCKPPAGSTSSSSTTSKRRVRSRGTRSPTAAPTTTGSRTTSFTSPTTTPACESSTSRASSSATFTGKAARLPTSWPTTPTASRPTPAAPGAPCRHKGNIFFADNNSGLWAVRLKPPVTEADDAGGSRN